MCHENYKDAKEGAPIGFLSYRLKVDVSCVLVAGR